MKSTSALLAALSFAFVGCDEGDKEEKGRESYSFTSVSTVQLKSSSASSLLLTADSPPMCVDNLCFTPIALTGKYYGAGLMLQSAGNGMMAYFGQESWSGTTGASTSYAFDFASPVTHSNDLVCCAGEGDLSDENTYISDAVYMFGYVDATFEIDAASGAHGDAIGTHTVRFVLADDAVEGGKRGDVLYQDAGSFQWMDAAGALQTTRPTDAITMDSSVVNWTNPFGTETGNQAIPVLSTSMNPPPSGGVWQVKEDELKTAGRSYSFDFNVTGFVTFPTLLKADVGMLDSRKALLSKIHVQGLPHSKYQMGDAGDTTLTIAGITP